jgi:hypothetical protein
MWGSKLADFCHISAKKRSGKGVRPEKSPKNHNRPVKIMDNWYVKNLAGGENCGFAWELRDF